MPRCLVVFAVLALAASDAARALAQIRADDAAAVIQFQRTVDSYAFLHRQVERRNGGQVDQRVMNDAMRRVRPAAVDGEIFTPLVSDALRKRIAHAIGSGCEEPAESTRSEIPRVGSDAAGSVSLSACLVDALPKLPAELEYREVGVVLILVDTHANLVIDVLHGAFPQTR